MNMAVFQCNFIKAGDRLDVTPEQSLPVNPCFQSSQLRRPLLSYDLKMDLKGYDTQI